MRIRAPIRSLQWAYKRQGKQGGGGKACKKPGKARIVIGDSEEGVSEYVWDGKELVLKGFDVHQKSVIYSDYLQLGANSNIMAALDYDGNFSIIDKIRGKNPLLKIHMHEILSFPCHSLTKKFIQSGGNNVFMLNLRGELI